MDRFVPDFDVSERHTLVIAAAPERVLAATRELHSKELPLFVLLMGLRGLPGLVRGHKVFRLDRPLLDELVRLGFVRLGETADALLLGISGRFWRLDGGLRRVPADEFASFAEPGWVAGGRRLPRRGPPRRHAAVDRDADRRHRRVRPAPLRALLARDPGRQRRDPLGVVARDQAAGAALSSASVASVRSTSSGVV